jgi:polyhydroxybutyrate depolymerase
VADDRNTTSRILIGVIVAGAVLLVTLVVVALVLRDAGRSDDRSPSPPPPSSTTTVSPTASTADGSTTTRPTTVSEVAVHDEFVQMGILRREYLVVEPIEVPAGERLPVVIALHGLAQDRHGLFAATDWRGAVARDGFIAVFPQGFANSWNLGSCCPPANLIGMDDLGFLDQVVAQLSARPDVDPERLYLSGFSNGGLMTYAVACARPGVYAAIAPMAGSNVSGCAPSVPISLLHQHADPDAVVPFDGNPTLTQLLSSADFPPVPQSVAAWAAADGCPGEPTVDTDDDGIERSEWAPCADDTRVELVRLPGAGHTWPTLAGYDALGTMLEFFGIS